MARILDNEGVDDNYDIASSGLGITDYPFTMAAWAIPGSINSTRTVCGLSDPTKDTDFAQLAFDGSVAGDPLVFRVGTARTRTTTGYSALTWTHLCGASGSATDHAVWINGGSKGTKTLSNNAAVTEFSIGKISLLSDDPYQHLSPGTVAEVAIWNVKLTDAEVAALASGVAADRIRPGSLKGYWRLEGDLPTHDWSGHKNTLTSYGSPIAANHAPVEPWAARFWGTVPLIGASADITLTPGIDTVVATGQAPTLAFSGTTTLTPGIDTVIGTGLAPTLVFSGTTTLIPGIDTVIGTGLAPTLAFSDTTTLTPGIDTVVFTGHIPIADVAGATTTLTPGIDTVVFTGLVPALEDTVVPGIDTVVFTGHIPLLVGDGDTIVVPGIDTVVATGLAPGVLHIAPALDTVVITGHVPVASLGPALVSTELGSIAFTGLVPTLGFSGTLLLVPALDTLVITGRVPALETTETVLSPREDRVLFAGLVPFVNVPFLLTPGLESIVFAGLIPMLTNQIVTLDPLPTWSGVSDPSASYSTPSAPSASYSSPSAPSAAWSIVTHTPDPS